MFTLLRQRNFALLWWGGLVSLTGNRVLSIALPFYIYQQTGSTLATATMVLATSLPSMLFSSIAGVFVDRWERKRLMVVTNLLLSLVLLPLFAVQMTGAIWIVYVVAFCEAAIAIFFGLAENALLPTLVGQSDLIAANSLNSLNDTIARLIGPAFGGLLLSVWEIDSVIIFDCLSYLLACILISGVKPPARTRQRNTGDDNSANFAWQTFRAEWQAGWRIVQRERVIALLFVVTSVTTLAGTMFDPLVAPWAYGVLHVNAALFGWMLTLQGAGGVIGGLLFGHIRRIRPAQLFGTSSIVVGLILFVMYRTVSIPLVLALCFLAGLPTIGSRIGLQTLFHENVDDEYRGRVYGLIGMIGSALELLSVSFAGIMSGVVGIVPLLSLAALLTVFAGSIALLLLPSVTSVKTSLPEKNYTVREVG
ncbi:MAG: MFS transporter [Caldilineaceae bacterium]